MNLSIIVPTTGRSTLEVVLEGLLRCKNFYKIAPEVIVVFSTGKTRCDSLRYKFPGMNFFRLSVPGKKVQARNLGIDLARGDVLAFLADDTIPSAHWLESVVEFHKKHPEDTAAMVGDIRWHSSLSPSKFRKWIGEQCEFAFSKIRRRAGKRVHWQHVYPCNFSVKRALLQTQRFCEYFSGWRYEGAELGYRLHQLGMQLFFIPQAVVWHWHAYTFERAKPLFRLLFVEAKIFETLHPNVRTLPQGVRAVLIRGLMLIARKIVPVLPEVEWWIEKHRGWVENSTNQGTITANENFDHCPDGRETVAAGSAGGGSVAVES